MSGQVFATNGTCPSSAREDVDGSVGYEPGLEGDERNVYGDLPRAHALYKRLRAYAPSLQHVQQSLDTIDDAFRLYTPPNVCVAFNGGKDATVVLHLTLASFANYVMSIIPAQDLHTDIGKKNRSTGTPFRLNCLYLTGKVGDNFSQVNAFVEQTVASVSVLLGTNVEMGIRDGIEQFVKTRTSMCAFVMGTRRTDPYSSNMKNFEPSSPGWPSFMRVNPILDWRYAQIWDFLRTFEIPFCSLYHNGYTSLGSVSTTAQNPALRRIIDNVVTYSPAWHLEDEQLERAGRHN